MPLDVDALYPQINVIVVVVGVGVRVRVVVCVELDVGGDVDLDVGFGLDDDVSHLSDVVVDDVARFGWSVVVALSVGFDVDVVVFCF